MGGAEAEGAPMVAMVAVAKVAARVAKVTEAVIVTVPPDSMRVTA